MKYLDRPTGPGYYYAIKKDCFDWILVDFDSSGNIWEFGIDYPFGTNYYTEFFGPLPRYPDLL